MEHCIRTYRYRIKDSSCSKHLERMAWSVNYVWNYCNETSRDAIKNHSRWLTAYDLSGLTKGCSRELGISSVTIQAVCEEYFKQRKKFKRTKLRWRSRARSLGWIPTKSNAIKVDGDTVEYCGRKFRFWKSRELEGKIKTASFSQDSRGRWYVNIQCEVPKEQAPKTDKEIGLDLGLKTIATASDGTKYHRESATSKYAERLAMAQRANKKRLVKTLHAKIQNSRKDWAHKVTTEIVKNNDVIVVGDVSPSKLQKTKMAKSVSDASWHNFKTMLEYKAIGLGKVYKEVKENFSTVTCSVCLEKADVGGLSNLGVREWECDTCGTVHDRDVNAAVNILRFGHESLKGIPLL